MRAYNDNGPEIAAQFAESIATFRFDAKLEGRMLGRVIADVIVDGIAKRSQGTQSAPSTGRLPPNRNYGLGGIWHGHAERKHRKYGWEDTNYRTEQMLSHPSLAGKVEVRNDLVTLTYGTGQPPSVGVGPNNYSEPPDRTVTDDDKAFYAHEQGRGFYELDEDIGEQIDAQVEEVLALHLQRRG
jgi:hypothetical protein